MGPFSMVLGIVVAVLIARTLQMKYRYDAQVRDVPPDRDATRMTDEVRQLKDRIAVLERLVTDTHGSVELDRQIERLRTPSTPAPSTPAPGKE